MSFVVGVDCCERVGGLLRRGETEHALAVTLDEALTPSRIIIRDRADVTNYLLSNPELIPLLGPICAQARQEFGQEADLEMFINHDPEIDDQHLTVLVRIPSYEEDFVQLVGAGDLIPKFIRPWDIT